MKQEYQVLQLNANGVTAMTKECKMFTAYVEVDRVNFEDKYLVVAKVKWRNREANIAIEYDMMDDKDTNEERAVYCAVRKLTQKTLDKFHVKGKHSGHFIVEFQ